MRGRIAVGLADLNRALDEIMADTIYSNAEGFTGFDFSDEKTLRAVKDVRRKLREERE